MLHMRAIPKRLQAPRAESHHTARWRIEVRSGDLQTPLKLWEEWQVRIATLSRCTSSPSPKPRKYK